MELGRWDVGTIKVANRHVYKLAMSVMFHMNMAGAQYNVRCIGKKLKV